MGAVAGPACQPHSSLFEHAVYHDEAHRLIEKRWRINSYENDVFILTLLTSFSFGDRRFRKQRTFLLDLPKQLTSFALAIRSAPKIPPTVFPILSEQLMNLSLQFNAMQKNGGGC